MKLLSGILVALGLALTLTGCKSAPVYPDGIEVVIKNDHRHSRYCGHYIHEERWYYVRHHKHAVGCGHEFAPKRGLWIIKQR